MDESHGEQPVASGAGGGQTETRRGRTPIALPAAALVAGVVLVLTLAAVSAMGLCRWDDLCGPVVVEDIAQGRLDTALPAPQGDLHIEQTFTPRRDGLSEVELILVRYGGEAGADPGTFSVALQDDNDALVASDNLSTQELHHNQVYILRFQPQDNSAGRRYTLRLSGNERNHISAWGYSLDVDAGGELRLIGQAPDSTEVETTAVEMRYVTRYTFTAGVAIRAAAVPLQEWRLLLAALLFLPLPGVGLLLAVRPRGWDRAAWCGAALGLGVAAWPVLWQWVSLAGGCWSGAALWGVVVAGWGAAAMFAWRRRDPTTPNEHSSASTVVANGNRPLVKLVYGLLAFLILATTASRFIAIRDLAYPPWVDSSRHALITAVMLESGQIPVNYEPYLPVDHFPYHYGFHTLSTSLIMMAGQGLPGALLFLMQLLGGLLPLAVYAAGWMVTRRRAVGLLAAFLVGLPFFFPGYYATWGRMTQLAAMVAMPVLLALTWRLGRGWPRVWPLVGVLAAGVFLIHFRVFLFYLPFAALALAAHLTGRRRAGGMAKAALLGGLLVSPRLLELLAVTEPLATFSQSLPGYNEFPIGYITTGWERAYLVAVVAAAAILVVGVARRRRWATFPLVLALWAGVLFALLAGERLGLPESLVVNLNSMFITLFLPQALFLAIVAGRVWGFTGRYLGNLSIGFLAAVAAGVALGLLVAFGWRQQINILNPQTILALPQDEQALEWIDDNLPADARVAVNSWRWLGATWAGSDGGAWVVPLTGRESTTPPVDHIYNDELFAGVRAFNEAATAITDWSEPSAADWLAAQGVTHVFVGRRGGFFDPAALDRNPSLMLLYGHDGAFVFAVATP